MKIKRITAAILSLCMVGGAFTFNAPTISNYSVTANAEDTCYTFKYITNSAECQ